VADAIRALGLRRAELSTENFEAEYNDLLMTLVILRVANPVKLSSIVVALEVVKLQ